MTDLFADERLQFFLRNREDIKTWAAIERLGGRGRLSGGATAANGSES